MEIDIPYRSKGKNYALHTLFTIDGHCNRDGEHGIHILQARPDNNSKIDDILLGYCNPPHIIDIIERGKFHPCFPNRDSTSYSSTISPTIPSRSHVLNRYAVSYNHHALEVVTVRHQDRIWMYQYWRIEQGNSYSGYTNGIYFGSGLSIVDAFSKIVTNALKLVTDYQDRRRIERERRRTAHRNTGVITASTADIGEAYRNHYVGTTSSSD